MNPILQNKFDELSKASDYECWYLVKQPTDFGNLCYLVSFLEEYKNDSGGLNLQDFISKKIGELAEEKPGIIISNNYRALRVAAYFGLILMTSKSYEDSIITDTFYEIKKRTNGNFENIDIYIDIIQRQIEKMYISSDVDEQKDKVRKDYRLYPVMLLYKVLLEIGRSTGAYSINIAEYKYLVATTKKFEDFLDTLLLIKLFREDSEYNNIFDQFRNKFDNRLIQALKQLPTLNIDKNSISIVESMIDEVSKKVFIFEKNPNIFLTDNYLEFLGSTKSLFDLGVDTELKKYKVNGDVQREEGGKNILLYGVPGSGKSHTIKIDYCEDESKIERVVFHPDYMNTDLIGQILPTIKEDGMITYEFTSGPFTKILKKAYEDPSNKYYLVIEEINRGNAPAIFGEVFQLLDRDKNGNSTYGITNENISRIVYDNPNQLISIPSNLWILATMNTADQNVFTLDTAFQRRWIMRMIKNDIESSEHANMEILDTGVTWKIFAETINNQIISSNSATMSSEDKRLGAYFITEEILLEDKENMSKENFNCLFAEKVIKYLWDDAFKFGREKLFNPEYKSLEKIIEEFSDNNGFKRFDIFETSIKDILKDKVQIHEEQEEIEEEELERNSEE
ncbi:McrB family protein [Helcococcus massiliensis]|uniref:McrB family protein n=1 Tax=Helcococcus massiliensis TaxID=2040290 RepID=UPI00190E72C1|nr:AAA family ATPase [Helcococcus massiliensis]